MNIIKNSLAIIGLCALLGLGIGYIKVSTLLQGFDPKAADVYSDMFKTLLKTKNAAEAMVWKTEVAEDVSREDVIDAIRLAANDMNLKNVGELPLSNQVTAMSGESYRYINIFMFCNALTAAKMLDYSDAFSAYLPCRISLLEDKQGKLWLYALNMDMMIYGGQPLPLALKKEALEVKTIILKIMERGAKGDF